MASKHDAKRASENHWVMQQNLARHKSVMGFVHKSKAPKPNAPTKRTAADAAVDEAKKSAAEVQTPSSES